MNATHSDALVFFGATGDLAFKKIFPSLQAMAGRGHLNVPVIGIGRSAPDLAALKDRARESLEKRGGVDPAAFEKLISSLRYVRGDNSDPATYAALRKGLNGAQRPAFLSGHPADHVRNRRGATRQGWLRWLWRSGYRGKAVRH